MKQTITGKSLKPKKRSKLRIALGKKYFTAKRYLHWYKNKTMYTSELNKENLNYIIAQHKTPLRRQLKNVDRFIDDHKIINLRLAIKQINGIKIKPQETFSYWKLIGKPTRKKGYIEGMVLDHGNYKLGVGGGLCQLSNLIFWMSLHTPLTITERHRHSYDVFPDSKRSQPFGSGATCVYNYRDLQLTNNTNEVYQINLKIDDKFLYGEIQSTEEKYLNYEVYESSHKISHEFWGGYLRHNKISRKVYSLNQELLDDQVLFENHAIMMYSPLLSPPTSMAESSIN